MSKLVPHTHEGELLPPLKPLEGEAEECLQMIAEMRRLSDRTNRLNNQARRANGKIDDLCLLLGFKLVGLRKRIEAGEVSVPWWDWFDRFLPNVSRKHAERWIRIASQVEPATAALEYRQRDAAYHHAHRQKQKQLTDGSETPMSDPTEPELALTPAHVKAIRRRLPHPLALIDDATQAEDEAADGTIDRIVQDFQHLPQPRQQDRCIRRLMAVYRR